MTTFFILKRTAASSPMLFNVEGWFTLNFLSNGLLIQIRLIDLYLYAAGFIFNHGILRNKVALYSISLKFT
jgi:hypothetical protein